jgi:hypothetical protein
MNQPLLVPERPGGKRVLLGRARLAKARSKRAGPGTSQHMLRQNVVEGIHMIDDAYVNPFLVEEERKLTVVDTGHPSS